MRKKKKQVRDKVEAEWDRMLKEKAQKLEQKGVDFDK